MNDDQAPTMRKIDKTMSLTAANGLAFALALPAMALFLLPYWLIWGSGASARPDLVRLDSSWSLGLFLVVVIASVVVHELLHGLGCLLGGASWRDVKFGFKSLTPYAHCKIPLTLPAYRLSIALPGIVLGIIPGLLGLINGSYLLTGYGAFMFMAALGDVLILWLLRDAPAGARVQDHPNAVGCELLLPEGERNRKL
jgi:hypothetical protein